MRERTRFFQVIAGSPALWVAGVAWVLGFAPACPAEEKTFDLFPMSKPWLDVRIPRYDDQDVLTSMMHTEALTRKDEKKLKLDGLTLVMFQSSGEISLRLKTKQGFYDVATSMLQTHSTTFIEHAQFEMTGDRLIFDTSKRQGTLQGNVEMRIFGVPVAPSAPSSPAAAPMEGQMPGAEGTNQAQPQLRSQPPPQPQPELKNAEQPAKSVEVVQANPSAQLLTKLPKP